ncbi:potassium/proton antiporter [uncultured Fibrobacter sp.]|uniref:potassium/proton antiporter n=1 Tax=uncultured Fibrobacter sp. TaxID=261512 RepID=UPI00280491C2|nr:potassium/proton antiporter [uncultured Fibrobacter sp.]
MIFFLALLIIASIFSTKISDKIGVPVLLVFLAVGIIVGSDVLGLIKFSDAQTTKRIADILLIFILFDGGFRTSRDDLQLVAKPATILATFGVLITAVVLGIAIHFIMDYEFMTSMMIGSIISSTDAAAVLLITRQNPLKRKIAATLNVESAANDPMAILLTLTFVGSLAGQGSTPIGFITSLLWQFTGGIFTGYLVSKVARLLFDKLKSENRGYYYVLIVGVILLAYGSAEIIKANGIIAVFFMGYWLGNSDFVSKRGVSNFLEGVSTFSNMTLFLMLGLLAFPRSFSLVWKEGLLIATLMIFIARPIAVFLSTIPFRFTMKERLFLCWGGIKGAVPIVLATYPAAYGIDSNESVFNIIFFAVILSCLLQGSSLGHLARLFKLTIPKRPLSPFSVELHSVRRADLDMYEFQVFSTSFCQGKCIKDLHLGNEVVITSITRNAKILPPKGGVQLQTNDILFILAPIAKYHDLLNYLENG